MKCILGLLLMLGCASVPQENTRREPASWRSCVERAAGFFNRSSKPSAWQATQKLQSARVLVCQRDLGVSCGHSTAANAAQILQKMAGGREVEQNVLAGWLANWLKAHGLKTDTGSSPRLFADQIQDLFAEFYPSLKIDLKAEVLNPKLFIEPLDKSKTVPKIVKSIEAKSQQDEVVVLFVIAVDPNGKWMKSSHAVLQVYGDGRKALIVDPVAPEKILSTSQFKNPIQMTLHLADGTEQIVAETYRLDMQPFGFSDPQYGPISAYDIMGRIVLRLK